MMSSQSGNLDHPHACGDKAICSAYLHGGIGSSPRVWGQDDYVYCHGAGRGIIPTRVGTSIVFFHNLKFDGDHPHACGDKPERIKLLLYSRGSSPRVWGQVQEHYNLIDCHRIIPTRVGTSNSVCSCVCFFQDHPHACGDKQKRPHRLQWQLGSSPRVWGQEETFAFEKGRIRIIPTRVGTRASGA